MMLAATGSPSSSKELILPLFLVSSLKQLRKPARLAVHFSGYPSASESVCNPEGGRVFSSM